MTVCWPDILAHFPVCILTLSTTTLQYGILGHNNMWHSQRFNFVWTWCHKPKTYGSQLTNFCNCKYLDTEVQSHNSISCSDNQMAAWRGVPTPNCNCSCMTANASFLPINGTNHSKVQNTIKVCPTHTYSVDKFSNDTTPIRSLSAWSPCEIMQSPNTHKS
jgi:hypothetical protein